MARDKSTQKILALKRVRMEKEKEGVGAFKIWTTLDNMSNF
jgi:hypothetical protein